MKCQKCQREVFLPFRCPYCGGYFCSDHRLPENHECPQMEQARTPKEEVKPIIRQKQKSFEYTITHALAEPTGKKIRFSGKEIKHLTIAALLVIGVALSLGIFPDTYDKMREPFMLAVFTVIFTASFFTHEVAHKVAAQRQRLWAEFRLTLIGAILTLFSIFLPLFKIISPGAVVVAGFSDRGSIGKVSIAGPATNITFSMMFLVTAVLFPQYSSIFMFAAFFNAWIALFNLIPFGVLDGFKVFLWSKKIWALAFTAGLVLTIIAYQRI